MRTVRVVHQESGRLVGSRILVAETSLRRAVGLLGERSLEPGEGLWIRPSSGVHTAGMRFAIDVVGLDDALRVVRLWPGLRPFRITGLHLRVTSVLELPAGTAAAVGMHVGDTVCVHSARVSRMPTAHAVMTRGLLAATA